MVVSFTVQDDDRRRTWGDMQHPQFGRKIQTLPRHRLPAVQIGFAGRLSLGIKGTWPWRPAFCPQRMVQKKGIIMKGIVAWLLGVPIVVIILFYLTGIF